MVGDGPTRDDDDDDDDGGWPSSSEGGGIPPPRSLSSSFPPPAPPRPQDFPASNDYNCNDPIIPPIYAFTPNTLSGMILSCISGRFVPRHRQHTHGGSALAGFLALLFVTCANCMLGPMRDAAALAVGVSHIPALTLASTVLALGGSVPVGWLFEAPDPRRRRVWRRMGLTRGETQGTSLALFYRVFAFLLLSYALGFVLVDRYGSGGGTGSGGNDGNGEEEGGEEEEGSAAIASIASIAVGRVLKFAERLHPGMRAFVSPHVAILETCAHESVPTLFLRACARVVNKFGKVIYIMFFLVVHLMKLHSLSLIWGVTTEAMEYEEGAEERMAAARERLGGGGGGGGSSARAGGGGGHHPRR